MKYLKESSNFEFRRGIVILKSLLKLEDSL
jgi:hypothetical protein